MDDVLKRLGERAEIPVSAPADLRHAHELRHTFARATAAAPVASPNCNACSATRTQRPQWSTSTTTPGERERLMVLAADEPVTLDTDREVA